MRTWTLAFVAVLAIAFAPALAAAEQELIGVQYSWDGPAGLLSFQGALGENFWAADSTGRVVASGTVPESQFTIPAINSGPDSAGVVLTVRVGGHTFSITNEWWEWQ